MTAGADDLGKLSALVRGRYGAAHEHHGSIGSTNDRALAWAREGAPDGAVVTADHQSAGRGRRGRAWVSEAGANLCATVLVRPPVGVSDFGAVSLVAGLAIARGIEGACRGARPRLKWPNDLELDGRKVGGVLCECRWVGDQASLAIGFGLNVHQTAWEGELASTATSLAATGHPISRVALLVEVLLGLERELDRFYAQGFAAQRAAYLERSSLVGARVRAVANNSEVEGEVVTIDDDGALVLDVDGATERITTGEVTRVRAVPPPSSAS